MSLSVFTIFIASKNKFWVKKVLVKKFCDPVNCIFFTFCCKQICKYSHSENNIEVNIKQYRKQYYRASK